MESFLGECEKIREDERELLEVKESSSVKEPEYDIIVLQEQYVKTEMIPPISDQRVKDNDRM